MHGVVSCPQQVNERYRFHWHEKISMLRMLLDGTSVLKVNIAARCIILEIGVYSKIAQKLYHENQMEIGIPTLKIIKQDK